MVRIGVDLGGTNIVAGVVNEAYEILAKARCKTCADRSAEEIMQDMARLCREAAQQAGVTMAEVESGGIGCPGVKHICFFDTIISYSNHNVNGFRKEFSFCRIAQKQRSVFVRFADLIS